MSAEELHEAIKTIHEADENTTYDIARVQPRWKSWAVWLSAIGAIWTILSAFGLPEKWGISDGTFKSVVDAIGVILTGFGILNNPTDPDNF